MFIIDSNTILVEPLSSRKYAKLTHAYRAIMLQLKAACVVPKKHILNNEVSEAMKTVICDEYKIEMEVVPPSCYCHNAAYVAIPNSKAHFLSFLASVADDFPKSLWDQLLPQAEITINLSLAINASVSAYAHLSGPFNYNKIPLAPVGCAAQIHEKTDKCGTWSYHSGESCQLSTSPKNYHTHNCYVKAT